MPRSIFVAICLTIMQNRKANKKDMCRKFEKPVRQQASSISTFVKSNNNRCKGSSRVTYYLGVEGKPYSDEKL